MGRLVNGYNMLKVLPNGDKKLYTMPEAVDFIREIMLRYNGRAEEWKNIIMFVDPGAGGGGLLIADYLRQDWVDSYGKKHHGVIDLNDEKSAMEKYNFPNAIPDVLNLFSPQKFKNSMFAALGEMVGQDLLIFPEPCPRGDTAYFDDGEIELTHEDRRGLIELDLTKEEVKLIKKMVTDKGNVRYGVPPNLERKVHDDRAYCAAAAAYLLSLLRKDDQFAGESRQFDFMKIYGTSRENANKIINARNRRPFCARNPFRRGKKS